MPALAAKLRRGVTDPNASSRRRALFVRGVVQGVGFRPFVHALATQLALGGFVKNRADGVLLEVEGEAWRLAAFTERLRTTCPPLAQIEELDVAEIAPVGERAFQIRQSERGGHPEARFFSPDVGTCEDCLRELFDPTDRRYLYPFINCAHCGPRLTILCDAPYDRERTTMAGFALCALCRAEYEDPKDRRFHAQPTACPACGPKLSGLDAEGRVQETEPLFFFEELLLSEQIIAVKGLGGYHLACDATSDVAVARLRRRKQRDEKPFAVMVPTLDAARRLCRVSPTEARLLGSPRRPIVLLQRLLDAQLAPAVAPKNLLLGLMLPYTPLHHLLLRAHGGRPLVMTSGNRSDEPIAFRDEEAVERLQGIADGFLTHDRPIHLPCDDSVARVSGKTSFVLRRSRGYAPQPLRLPFRSPRRILALGGHLKNTFAVGRGKYAFLSHHLGDLGDFGAYRAFRAAVAHYESLFAFCPEVLAHDLHPDYATTAYARDRHAETASGLRLIAVQHHHAHMASCMAENHLVGPVIGVTFDGSGCGTDGSLWGGEFLVGDYRRFRRAAHLRAVRLPGGEQAMREPWRMALSHLLDSGEEPSPLLVDTPPESQRIVRQMIENGINSPLTTSAGRLFDAVAALLELRTHVTFEGQAAMELEGLASTSGAEGAYPFGVASEHAGEDGLIVDTRPIVTAIVRALRRGDPPAHIAKRFHNTLVALIADVTTRLHQETGLLDVVLTGGVFQNARLLQATKRELESRSLRVHVHSRVPPNDGGIALGQLAVAAAILKGEA